MTGDVELEIGPHEDEPHDVETGVLLNWLRAAVLGANDGIVSVAGMVMGIAGATSDRDTILLGGVAGLVAGAISMAAGEYVSVSTQSDTEAALLEEECRELEEDPEGELAELAGIYRDRGLSEELALRVAEELTAHDALAAHAEAELHLDPDERTSAWHAAWASLLAFTAGALLPLLSIVLLPEDLRIPGTGIMVVLALALTGLLSAKVADAPAVRAMLRNITGGVLAMAVTFAIGDVVGRSVL